MKHHLVGSLMHFFYLFVFMVYVAGAYIWEYDDMPDLEKMTYVVLLLLGILYPVIYESIQML